MNRLNESHIPIKCPMKVENMQATNKGHFCGKCQTEVFDLTNCSMDEIRALEKKHGPICGSIRVAQAATVAISLAAAACQEQRAPGKISPPPAEQQAEITESKKPTPPLLGKIRVPPEIEKEKAEVSEPASNEQDSGRWIGRIALPPSP